MLPLRAGRLRARRTEAQRSDRAETPIAPSGPVRQGAGIVARVETRTTVGRVEPMPVVGRRVRTIVDRAEPTLTKVALAERTPTKVGRAEPTGISRQEAGK
jgi:hypothetical protein